MPTFWKPSSDLNDLKKEYFDNQTFDMYPVNISSDEKRKNIDHPNFSSILTVATGEISYDLRFGFSPIASDGYDQGIDKYAPPPPPPPFFDAALWWMGERYYTQIVKGNSGDLIEHVWDIKLAFPPSNQITLTWDSNSLKGLGRFLIQDGIDGSQIPLFRLS